MSLRLLAPLLFRTKPIQISQIRLKSLMQQHCEMIGKREIVGYGYNGDPWYVDRPDFPFPAIRWQEDGPELQCLQGKEKGDWRALTKEEKKQLYRASYRQTFAEFMEPTGFWKSVLGWFLFAFSVGLWYDMFLVATIYDDLPTSFCENYKRAQFRRILDLKVNPILGISSMWDYTCDTWK